MTSEKNPSFEVKDFYLKTKDFLKIKPAIGRIGFTRRINRFSLPPKTFPIQVWGKKEAQDLKSFPSKKRKKYIKSQLCDDTLCLILADGLTLFSEIEQEARRQKASLFFSDLSQKKCLERLKTFFSSFSANQIITSGGMLQISGIGVLIIGDSGIGKSESTLELVSRGHRFVCDDVILVKRTKNSQLTGTAPSFSRYFMEIRGLGVINIKEIFGSKAICSRSNIDIVIKLMKWKRGKEYDRLGPEFPESYEILGVKIPQVSIPVALGRNIATLIEVACKVHILREKGYNATEDITRKLNRELSHR